MGNTASSSMATAGGTDPAFSVLVKGIMRNMGFTPPDDIANRPIFRLASSYYNAGVCERAVSQMVRDAVAEMGS